MHDALFKASFGQPDIARSELELMLPRAVLEHLDMATLAVSATSVVDEELRSTHSDLLFSVATRASANGGGDALVYVLFEHQSSFDETMPLRLLNYVVRLWLQWLRDHPGSSRLPIILPVVLHHGPEGWAAAPSLASMLDAPTELIAAARSFLPLFDFVLDDLAALSLETLASRALMAHARLVQIALWSSRSRERLLQAVPLMRAIAGSLDRDERTRQMLVQLYVYFLLALRDEFDDMEVRTILMTVAGPQGQEDVMSAGQRLIEQGRAEGKVEGRAEGRAEGVAEALQALRRMIATTLSARGLAPSEVARARLATCNDLDALGRWLTRAATASSEAEVFAE